MKDLLLVGYGKMGHAIEKACVERGWAAPTTVDTFAELEGQDMSKFSLAIEFTEASVCVDNYAYLLKNNVPVISGTTGWLDRQAEVRALVEETGGTFLHASNFAIGVRIFEKIVERAAQLINGQESYDVYCHEVHHPHKKDAPSGTMLDAARTILKELDRKTELVTGDVEGPLPPEALHCSSSRGGYQAGAHTVTFDSSQDTLTITHFSKGRGVFANGVLDCAQWLQAQGSGYFTIEDYLKEVL